MPFTGTDDALVPAPGAPFDNAWEAASGLMQVYVGHKRALDAHLQNFESGLESKEVLEAALKNFEDVYRRGYQETNASLSTDYVKMRVVEETQELYQLVNPSWHI